MAAAPGVQGRPLRPWVPRVLQVAVLAAGLTGLVLALYLIVVFAFGRLPTDQEWTLLALSMVAAGAAALLWPPLSGRLSRLARRLVHRERAPPDEVLHALSARLARAIPLEELLLQLAESLRGTFGLAAVEVWTGSGGVLELGASSPSREADSVVLSPPAEAAATRAGVLGQAWARVWLPAVVAGRETANFRLAPATHGGELYGLLVAERAPEGEAFSEEEERVLAELARQVGLAVHNVRLDSALQATLDELRRQADELRASRARIVAAADDERRRIERDLHDGAQQHLVALSVELRLARELTKSDAEHAAELLAELGRRIEEALEELRDLAQGVYPPLLADGGLGEALPAAGARAPIPVRVKLEPGKRYPPAVETAVYFCCLEALQNASKHAGPQASAVVRVWEEDDSLRFEIADDGAGFDPRRRHGWTGLTSMGDRIGAIGGSVHVDSEPGRGTRVSGAIPLAR